MSIELISTTDAPQAIGTYSQAVKMGGTVYVSGQIPLVPETMEMVEGGIDKEIRRVFDNLAAVANAAGCDLSDIAKFNIFLIDQGNFSLANGSMSDYFSETYPVLAVLCQPALSGVAGVELKGTV